MRNARVKNPIRDELVGGVEEMMEPRIQLHGRSLTSPEKRLRSR